MTTSSLVFSPLQQNLRQSELGFFGNLRGKMAEASETLEQDKGILVASELLQIAAPGHQTINQIERLAHGAASLQTEVIKAPPRPRDYTLSPPADKINVS